MSRYLSCFIYMLFDYYYYYVVHIHMYLFVVSIMYIVENILLYMYTIAYT